MSTLQNLPSRESKRYYETDIELFFGQIKDIAEKYKLRSEDVIEGLKVLEMRRRNDLLFADGDLHDLQMAGIGQILEQVVDALLAISEKK